MVDRWWLVSSGFSLEARGEGPLLAWKWPTLVCSRSGRGASTTRATQCWRNVASGFVDWWRKVKRGRIRLEARSTSSKQGLPQKLPSPLSPQFFFVVEVGRVDWKRRSAVVTLVSPSQSRNSFSVSSMTSFQSKDFWW